MSLTPEDLAYMRGEIAAFLTVPALLERRLAEERTATGGRRWAYATPAPVAVSLNGTEDVPVTLADRANGGTLYRVRLPHGEDVRDGDRLHADGSTYEVISEGEPEDRAVQQHVWARLLTRPPRE